MIRTPNAATPPQTRYQPLFVIASPCCPCARGPWSRPPAPPRGARPLSRSEIQSVNDLAVVPGGDVVHDRPRFVRDEPHRPVAEHEIRPVGVVAPEVIEVARVLDVARPVLRGELAVGARVRVVGHRGD